MARARSLPTNLFDDPDFFELDSATQALLLGLVLLADDHGRGRAHPDLLARKLNKPLQQIEEGLQQLEQRGYVCCYQVGRHQYLCLSHWHDWQTLSRPAQSKFPAPPETADEKGSDAVEPDASAQQARISETPLPAEQELPAEEAPQRGSPTEPPEVSPSSSQSMDALESGTHNLAEILRIPVTPALQRIVEDYHADPSLSLFGEADAAREYVDDPRRNQKGQPMTPAFFRRWLKREQEDRDHRLRALPTSESGHNQPQTPAQSAEEAARAERKKQYEIVARRREQEVLAAVAAGRNPFTYATSS